jgi:methylenetetrahydrofolate reductase (NADPH)
LRTFQQAARDSDFTLTAELPLCAASNRRSIERDIGILGEAVDALQVTDNPTGIPHMSPLVAAGICLENGKDAVVHISGRDRNRIALQSDILGAAAAGLTSLLLIRGDKLPADLSPRARKVYEFGAKRLLRCAALIGGESSLVAAPGFFLGSMISVIAPQGDWHPRGIEAKADVGCKFVQTQPLLDLRLLRRYMERLVASRVIRRVSVIVSVPMLSSVLQLEALLKQPRPACIPEAMINSLRTSRSIREDGIAILSETLDALSEIPGISGANVVAIDDACAAAGAISLSEISRRRQSSA